MIAAARRRFRTARQATGKRLRARGPAVLAASAKLDRAVDRRLRRAWPHLARAGRLARALAARLGRRLRPAGVIALRVLAWLERRLLRAAAVSRRLATRASAVLTPHRAICLTILGASAALVVSQFIDYRAVEIGQPGYAGLVTASAPTTAVETAGEAHSFLLIPVAALAAVLSLLAIRNERRRGLGRVVFPLGLLSLAVVLLVDRPAGLDVGSAASSFAGARAVLYDGFYAEIAAAAGMMLGGMLLVLAPRGLRRDRRVRLADAGPSVARTQGGRIAALFGRPRTPPRAASAAARRARGS